MSTDDQMSIEERVRTATRAGASLIRDVPPLGAPAPVRLRRRQERAPRRWVSWGVPLAAAAAVVAIALTLVAVRQPGHPAPAVSQTATTAPATAVPRYYAMVAWNAHTRVSGPLIVGDDLTGTVIDTVSPPPGLTFSAVRGTADDRTFVVETAAFGPQDAGPPYSWYLLRIAPGSAHPYQLTKLAVKLPTAPPGSKTFVLAWAPSPDGRTLAVETTPDINNSLTTLAIYSVSTSARLHAWTAAGKELSPGEPVHTVYWIDGGRQLVFIAATDPNSAVQLRAIDAANAGTDLLAGSRALLTPDSPRMPGCDSLPQITPDGGTVICSEGIPPGAATGSDTGCANGALKFVAIPLPISGKPGRVLYQYQGVCHDSESSTLWTDASGSSVIGVTQINVSNAGTKEVYRIGVFAGGQFRPLRIAPSIAPADYAALAF